MVRKEESNAVQKRLALINPGVSPIYNGPSIFGMSLAEATARSNDILGTNDTVPRIVKACISYIEAKGYPLLMKGLMNWEFTDYLGLL